MIEDNKRYIEEHMNDKNVENTAETSEVSVDEKTEETPAENDDKE